MLNRLDVDDKVGQVAIKFDTDNEWDDEVVRAMFNNYRNVYDISVYHRHY